MPGRPKGVAKQHKVKDVNKPKRAATAYFCYLGHCRKKEKDAGRKISKVALFTKEVAVKWRALADHERKEFDDEALQDKQRYEEQMRQYKGPQAVKDASKPKRAQSSYFFFLPGFRKSMEDSSLAHTDKIKKAGEQWRGMTDDEKAPYEQMAREDQARYEVAIQAWRKKNNAAAAAATKQAQQNNSTEDDEDDEEEEDDDEEEDEDEDDDDDE